MTQSCSSQSSFRYSELAVDIVFICSANNPVSFLVYAVRSPSGNYTSIRKPLRSIPAWSIPRDRGRITIRIFRSNIYWTDCGSFDLDEILSRSFNHCFVSGIHRVLLFRCLSFYLSLSPSFSPSWHISHMDRESPSSRKSSSFRSVPRS